MAAHILASNLPEALRFSIVHTPSSQNHINIVHSKRELPRICRLTASPLAAATLRMLTGHVLSIMCAPEPMVTVALSEGVSIRAAPVAA
jgi:hypothetical protein